MSADRIHLAPVAPPRCSSCFQQKVEHPHVDFEAAWDGPAFEGHPDVAGAKVQTIDDLILCDVCITAAARLIGLEDAGPLHDKIAELSHAREALGDKLEAALEHIRRLEEAGQSRAALAQAVQPAAPPPVVLEPKPSPGPSEPKQRAGGKRRKPAAAAGGNR